MPNKTDDEKIATYLVDMIGQTVEEFTTNKNKQFSFEHGLFAGFKIGIKIKKINNQITKTI